MSVNQRVDHEKTLDGRGFPGFPGKAVCAGFADRTEKSEVPG